MHSHEILTDTHSKPFSAVIPHSEQRRKRLQQVERREQRLPQRRRRWRIRLRTTSLGPARSPQGRQRGLPPREEGPLPVIARPRGVQGRYSLHFPRVAWVQRISGTITLVGIGKSVTLSKDFQHKEVFFGTKNSVTVSDCHCNHLLL